MQRRRFKQTQSVEERLSEEAKRLRAEAKLLPPGTQRDVLIGKARQAETASRMNEWLTSPGLQPPTQRQGRLSWRPLKTSNPAAALPEWFFMCPNSPGVSNIIQTPRELLLSLTNCHPSSYLRSARPRAGLFVVCPNSSPRGRRLAVVLRN